jgi:hypothetical protein
MRSVCSSSPSHLPSPCSTSTLCCLLWHTGQLRNRRLRLPLTSFCNCTTSSPTPDLSRVTYLEVFGEGASEDDVMGETSFTLPKTYPQYPTANSMQPYYPQPPPYPQQFLPNLPRTSLTRLSKLHFYCHFGDHPRVAIWSWKLPWRPLSVHEVSPLRVHPCHVSCPHPRCRPQPPRLGQRPTFQCAYLPPLSLSAPHLPSHLHHLFPYK